jgi:hypothetical protein
MSFEDTEDFAASNALDLSNAVRITKNNTDLGRSQTLLSKLANSLINLKQIQNINTKKTSKFSIRRV